MVKSVTAFVDKKGNMHVTLTSAVIADLADTLGRVGEESGMTEGVARLILAKRDEIEQAFADLDELSSKRAVKIPVTDDDLDKVIELSAKQGKARAND